LHWSIGAYPVSVSLLLSAAFFNQDAQRPWRDVKKNSFAARQLGLDFVPVIVLDHLSPMQRRALPLLKDVISVESTKIIW